MRLENLMEKVLGEIKPSERELKEMQDKTKEFVDRLEKNLKKKKIKADVFIGGSSGKKTIVKREKQDIDIFVRFDKRCKEEKISKLLENVLTGINKTKIHGSRDYFKVKLSKNLGFEIVPVLKIRKPEEAKNVTDLSYFHVSYVKKQLKKKKKLAEEIMLAKSFCYAQNCYGAESYIKGFSGYALELLVIYYGSFLSFVKNIAKLKANKKLVVDLEKSYKNKRIEEEMNEAKLDSPIIFVDPTYKERNVTAGLSHETFYKFQKSCRSFIRKPNKKFFERQKIDKKKFNLILIAGTKKQEGDIAGSKLYKFFKLMERELKKYFEIKNTEFEYDGKEARLYFKVRAEKFLILEGPPVLNLENVASFRKKHKNIFIRKGRVYAKERGKNSRKFLIDFKKDNKKRMKDMGISGLKVS